MAALHFLASDAFEAFRTAVTAVVGATASNGSTSMACTMQVVEVFGRVITTWHSLVMNKVLYVSSNDVAVSCIFDYQTCIGNEVFNLGIEPVALIYMLSFIIIIAFIGTSFPPPFSP